MQWRASVPAARLRPGRSPLALRIGLDDGSGFDLTEAGTEKRLALWLVTDPEQIEPIARLGPDPLDPAFDAGMLAQLLSGRKAQIKGVLTDQSVIAGVGNAYSDEALHVARMSPFKTAGTLTADEVVRLHDALVGVLGDAVVRSAGLPAAGLKTEKRSGLRVHGRTGQVCPACGDTVREVAFATKSLQYCPSCQTGGKPLADRRLSRLLK
jgi:formamidopyrimidine-DNA glycosylase